MFRVLLFALALASANFATAGPLAHFAALARPVLHRLALADHLRFWRITDRPHLAPRAAEAVKTPAPPAPSTPAAAPGLPARPACPNCPNGRCPFCPHAGILFFLPMLGAVFALDPSRKLGLRKPHARDVARRLSLAKYVANVSAPAEWDFSGVIQQWLMLLNDSLGDCGPAAMYHGLMSRLAMLTSQVATPTDADVTAFYSAAGGYVPGESWTDQGVDNPTMLKTAQTTGLTLAGKLHLLGPYATAGGADRDTINKAGWALGGCLVGLDLPQSWYQNSGPGNTWAATNSPNIGGHDVWMFAANAIGPKIITWGEPTQMTWAGCAQCATDVTGIADPNGWVNAATGVTPTGVALADWQADVLALTGQQPGPLGPLPPAPAPVAPPASGDCPPHRRQAWADLLFAAHSLLRSGDGRQYRGCESKGFS